MGGMRGADERSPRVTSAAGVVSQPERGPLSGEGKAQPALEVPDEDAAPPARAARRHDLIIAEQVRRPLRYHALEMSLGQLERQSAVGDDLVPVLHYVGLAHRR